MLGGSRALVVSAVALVGAGVVAPACADPSTPSPVPCPGCYVPAPDARFQWDLGEGSETVDLSVRAELFDVDWELKSRFIRRLHARRAKVFCYLTVGSWDRTSPDAGRFPRRVIGRRYAGFPDERWLDVRRVDVLLPIMSRRFKRCKRRGFDGVQLDNIDGFDVRTGFRIKAGDQLYYNATLANEAHRLGLGVGFENNPKQASLMVPYFDWVIYELDRRDVRRCFYDLSCTSLGAFRTAGKAVFAVEYRRRSFRRLCQVARARRVIGLLKREELGGFIRRCPRPTPQSPG